MRIPSLISGKSCLRYTVSLPCRILLTGHRPTACSCTAGHVASSPQESKQVIDCVCRFCAEMTWTSAQRRPLLYCPHHGMLHRCQMVSKTFTGVCLFVAIAKHSCPCYNITGIPASQEHPMYIQIVTVYPMFSSIQFVDCCSITLPAFMSAFTFVSQSWIHMQSQVADPWHLTTGILSALSVSESHDAF